MVEQFVHRVLGDTSATTTTVLAGVGDRLGLFKDLHAHGASTMTELAKRTGIRSAMGARVVERDGQRGLSDVRPREREVRAAADAPALAHERGPVFFGGAWDMLPSSRAPGVRSGEGSPGCAARGASLGSCPWP